MSEKSDAQRKGALYDLIPHLFDEGWVGHHNANLLYVGARESRIDYGSELRATHAVVLGCPWSTYCQGDLEGNPHERHVAHLEGPELKELGYSICQTGTRGEPGSNIAAVKFVSPE